MKNKSLLRFAFILFVIGLMMAIQFNTVNSPDRREIQDVWEIRQELSKEKQLHSELLSEIGIADETLSTYEAVSSQSPERALKETLENLRAQAGLTEVTGPGLEVLIEPSPEAVAFGMPIGQAAPDLLIRFMNEINRTAVLHAAIDGKRIVNSTAIRDINGQTTVNTLPVRTPPFQIKIITRSMEETEKLHNYLLASPLIDDFYIDNLSVHVSEPKEELTIPPFDGELNLDHLQPAEEG